MSDSPLYPFLSPTQYTCVEEYQINLHTLCVNSKYSFRGKKYIFPTKVNLLGDRYRVEQVSNQLINSADGQSL